MKKGIILTLLLVITACKGEKKVDKIKVEDSQISTVKEEYEEIESTFEETEVIFYEGFSFFDEVLMEEIKVLKTGGNRYRLAYVFNYKSDFRKIEDMKLAFRIYPKNPELFKNRADQEAKAKTIASVAEIKLMDNLKTIMSNEFELIPKDFQKVKVYFYTSEDGIMGKTMTILNVQFP